jgi:hypothetical protein
VVDRETKDSTIGNQRTKVLLTEKAEGSFFRVFSVRFSEQDLKHTLKGEEADGIERQNDQTPA